MNKKFLVSIDSKAKISEVARKLVVAGMAIDEKDAAFGLITGSADSAALPALKHVDGVRNIEEERTFESPEREASVQ